MLIGDNTEANSVLGDKADGLTQSAAHLAGSKALSMVGIPAELTMGVNAFGSEIENAYKNGASHAEALVSGAVAVGAEILFEKLSGGIKFGGKTLDEGATKALSRNLSNRIIRSILKWTGNALLEGGEGYLTDATTNVVRKLTYADDKTWKEIFWSEEALDSFIGEMIIGGGFSGYDAVNSHVNGRDYAAGLTANEEKLVRQEYEKHIAEAMEKGQKLNAADKNKIWEAAVEEILGNQAAISEIEKIGWDGRVAVEPVTGPKVTVGGKTYALIGYDKDGAKVYQDVEVLREQRGQLKEKDDQTQENREKNLRFIENDAKIKAQSGLPKKLVGLPDEKLKHPVKIDISPQKPGDFEFHAIAPKAADLTEVEIMAGEGTSTPIRDVRRLYEVYNLDAQRWQKKSGTTYGKEYHYVIHWYENDGIIPADEIKLKGMKKNK